MPRKSPAQVARILAKSKGKCWYCGCQLTPHIQSHLSPLPTAINLEHQIPKTKGGTNREENLVYSCQTCNSSKGGSTVEEYRLRLQRKADPEISACNFLKKAIAECPDLHGAEEVKRIIKHIEGKELPQITFYGELVANEIEVAS